MAELNDNGEADNDNERGLFQTFVIIYENLGSQKLVNSARRRTKIPRLGLLHMRYKACKESLTKKNDKRSQADTLTKLTEKPMGNN
ncbi:hypothetical protein DPMN_029537 [Dreissena polymorpha]|uniref:Uncharacterized protein n=1 Tax=Dreissena polymorpha TaxID=45954 RepID=A0A9D4RGC1_DREPO|nr:hypothetical protein DPMN_029537 [Dreissena polymorpha]